MVIRRARSLQFVFIVIVVVAALISQSLFVVVDTQEKRRGSSDGLFLPGERAAAATRPSFPTPTASSFLQKDPTAKQWKNITSTIVTVLLNQKDSYKDFGYSLLDTAHLENYGTLQYDLTYIDLTANSTRHLLQEVSPPCILASQPQTLPVASRRAPQCFTWVINDEWCHFPSGAADIRFYYDDNNTDMLYMPLGPRYDFWKVYNEQQQPKQRNKFQHQHSPQLRLTKDRQYIFNAIFSRSTSPSRKELHALIKNNSSRLAQENPDGFYKAMPKEWKRSLTKNHLQPAKYLDVLQNSIFSLAPTGHNPECFRIYEAILAGSIPIVVLDDNEYKNHPCKASFLPLLGGTKIPWIQLTNWNQLWETLDALLLLDSNQLDHRRDELLSWYASFITSRVEKLEWLIQRPRTGD